MIINIKGNLLESDAEALVNTVNTVGIMGKGIALQFREAFPENYRIYKRACQNNELHVGELLITQESTLLHGMKTIVNFPTKIHWRYPSEYSYIAQGLKTLRKEIKERHISSIAIPPLGSHNGGLDWMKVKEMVETELEGMNCKIYLYEPSDSIIEKMKSERIRLTPARAMMLMVAADMNRYGEFASVFALEKAIYFLQRFGGQEIFKIDFKPYIYGPYSGGKVAHVLYRMNGSYIKGMVGMQNRPFDYIWLTDDAAKDAYSFISNHENKELMEICSNTMKFLSPYYSNYSLELLSTVDYVLNNKQDFENWRNQEEEAILQKLRQKLHDWSSRKEKMFKAEHLELAVNYLRQYEGISYN